MQNLRQLHDVDLKLLRSFCTIVDEGSFTAAQTTLNLSQSALSEYLKSLELRLGVRLCQRGPKGFKLFPEGEIVYKAAQELFASVELFKQRAALLNGGSGYELSIAIQDCLVESPDCRMAEALERFTSYFPGVALKIEIMLGYKLIGRIADGLVDVGVGLRHEQLDSLKCEQLFTEQAYLYCSMAHPLFRIADEDVSDAEVEAASYCHRGHFEYFHPDPTEHFALRGDVGLGAAAQLALILSGRNIGYLPGHLAEPLVAKGRLRTLRADHKHLQNPVVAILGRQAGDSRMAQCFVDCLVDCHMEAAPAKPAPHLAPRRTAVRAR
jgi:DNA-binding transcriptional LysR family regulator